MTVGAVVQASYSREQLIVGRIVSGIGLGIVNSTVPVLQAEFSPKASRGIRREASNSQPQARTAHANLGADACAQISTLNFGIFLVYWIDYAFSAGSCSAAWRVPVVLQCLCIFPILGMLPVIPEKPRWLAAHGRPDECLRVLARMRSVPVDDADVRRIHRNIVRAVSLESSIRPGSWRGVLRNDRVQSRTRLLIACAIQSLQQLGGINAVV